LRPLEAEGALVTFSDADDCIAKVRYCLDHEAEREAVALKGRALALQKFNYRDIARRVMDVIGEEYEKKTKRR
jgi:spore maturation protein CgeB